MPFANSGDPHIPAKSEEFEKFTKGTYEMLGIEDFFTKDEQGYPTFKPINNDLKCHCHFSLADYDGASLPAWSGTAQDYFRLAKALGANVDGLTVESTTKFLLEIEKRINAEPRYAGIYVGENGWVKKINAMLPPTGFYRVKFVKAFSVDGSEPISFQFPKVTYTQGKPQEQVLFQFQIVSGIEGETDYAGNVFAVTVYNPFDGTMDGNPAWKHAENGGMLIAQKRMGTFLGIFWPDAEEYKWITDPEQSGYGINEAENPIVVIVDKASKSGKQAMTRIETTEKGFIKMDLQDLAPVKGSSLTGVQPVVNTNEQPPWKTDEPALSESKKKLMAVINNEAYPKLNKNVFDPSAEDPWKLTPEGSEWCKKNVIPTWDQLKFGDKHSFRILTDEQADMLAKSLSAAYDTSTF